MGETKIPKRPRNCQSKAEQRCKDTRNPNDTKADRDQLATTSAVRPSENHHALSPQAIFNNGALALRAVTLVGHLTLGRSPADSTLLGRVEHTPDGVPQPSVLRLRVL